MPKNSNRKKNENISLIAIENSRVRKNRFAWFYDRNAYFYLNFFFERKYGIPKLQYDATYFEISFDILVHGVHYNEN